MFPIVSFQGFTENNEIYSKLPSSHHNYSCCLFPELWVPIPFGKTGRHFLLTVIKRLTIINNEIMNIRIKNINLQIINLFQI